MAKVVINNQHGGFGLSPAAVARYAEIKGIAITGRPAERPVPGLYLYSLDGESWSDSNVPRDDSALVQVVEELGGKANGIYSSLMVVEIPDDVEWQIEEYDGAEWVAEKHRTWP